MSGVVNKPVEQEPDSDELKRPRTVGECRDGIRPCPWVSCRFNLLIDVSDNGAITFNVPRDDASSIRSNRTDPDATFVAKADAAVDHWFGKESVRSCLIDEVTEPRTLEEIASMLCTSRERVRQIELIAAERLTRGVAREMDVRSIEDITEGRK